MTATVYDVFISHAYEDKDPFVNELALALKKSGLKVWYSGFELKIGDSIAENVNAALRDAKYSLVIVSPVYLEKQWAMAELNALFSQEAERNRILPILHHISVRQIQKRIPILADRFAISSGKNMAVIVNKIVQVVKGKRKYTRKNSGPEKKPAKKKKQSPKGAAVSNAGFITLGGTINIKGGQVAGGDIHNHEK